MANINPRRKEEIMDTYRRYLDLALRRHSKGISNLSEKSFDAVYITSTMFRLIAFIMLRDRPLNPYTLLVLWL
jgi:hypothetical protein